jgi:hypothetical protein
LRVQPGGDPIEDEVDSPQELVSFGVFLEQGATWKVSPITHPSMTGHYA